MCKYSATDGIALCLHAVQQCGCKIIQDGPQRSPTFRGGTVQAVVGVVSYGWLASTIFSTHNGLDW
jgi:anaerobic C4-dicarboxylate transporter